MKMFYLSFILGSLLLLGCQKKEEESSPYQNLLSEEEEPSEWVSPRNAILEEEWGGEEALVFDKESD